MSVFEEYKSKYDLGTYDPKKFYTGPFWVGKSVKVVLGQSEWVNFISYLHDNAYDLQVESAKKIDQDFRLCIIEKTNNEQLADIYYFWVRKLNFLSWYSSKFIKYINNLRGK